jgi:hypothetical protein
MADNKNKMQMTPEEVQQTVLNQGSGQAGNMNGYQQVTPVDMTDGTPRGSAWRSVQQTGNAKTDYNAMLGMNPLAYQSPYNQQMNQTVNNLLGQKPFNYDVNTDALYQQIKDNYIRQGKQAMMDTQGMSAALTGGYGNTYGVLAGQQAYQDSLGNLSAQIPELYQLAYNRYLNNENSQRNNLAALQGLDESEYQRYVYETQGYEQKLADLYAKYKASQGGGGGGVSYNKFKGYVDDAMAWADATGGDVSDFIDQAVGVGAMPVKIGDAVKHAAGTYQGYVNSEREKETAASRAEENNATLNKLRNLGLLRED